ncbi:hypothetical protein VP424E501_P0248 [Vibrio phage 424E50-1]|nr:hypothetical protein VP424E501_P0248 [Vibrio phage 424E50-1]
MTSIILGLYLIASVVFTGILIVKVAFDNVFPKKWWKWFLFFLPATVLTAIVCIVSYAGFYYTNGKRKLKENR